jgi:acyl transferase domain-containing protein/acyl carrier protein
MPYTHAKDEDRLVSNGRFRQKNEPLAIVGIGCRFPGGAHSPDAFWQMLCDKRDGIREVPPDRWLLKAFYDPDSAKPGRTYAREGGYLEDIDRFDAAFFGISPREAAAIDPQHRLLLECTWEALEDGGLVAERLSGSDTGVFIGISTHDYADVLAGPFERKREKNPYQMLGSALCIAANRISYFLDLHGPSMAVDTACSSSLVALHLACQSIWRGESCQAIVGGVNLLLKPEATVGFSEASMLSPGGRCKSFDAAGDGYARAEGAGVIVLKPLAAAQRDGDRVYAVVLATATNQDGHTSSIAVPGEAAQSSLIRQACSRAGIRPADVQYVEAHGTGTPVGDPIELRALGAVFSDGRSADKPCLVGSVKSNIGHLEAGAGLAGLIKLALALYHGQIPANLHFHSPNPHVDLEALRLRVADRLQPWPQHDGVRRLGAINSFGFGGSNANAILAAAPDEDNKETRSPEHNGAQNGDHIPSSCELVPLSARSPEALSELARAFRDRFTFGTEDVCLRDLARSAALRRSHHAHRLALVATSNDELIEQLETFLAGESPTGSSTGRAVPGSVPRLVFVFTGMGPQRTGMGKQLLLHEPVFRKAIERCDQLFRRHITWSVLEELQTSQEESRMLRDDAIAQMAIFSLQVGLTELWKSWGVAPDLVLGHSAGETAAAYAAGALGIEDAVLLCYHRSRLQGRTAGQGRMLAVALSPQEAEAVLAPYRGTIEVGAINSPRSVTLTGDAAALVDLEEKLNSQDVFCRLLHGNIPYHSRKMEPCREELSSSLASLNPRFPRIPFFATATASLIDGPSMTADYWWRNVRHPVRFAEVIAQLLGDGHSLFLEVGPHPVLAHSLRECASAAGKDITVLASLRRQDPERAALLATFGQLYSMGRPIDWERLYSDARRWVSLPLYPWQRERFWREQPLTQQLRTGAADWTSSGHVGLKIHPLLGQAVNSPHVEAAWDNDLDLQRDHSWLSDHRIQGTIVFPAAGYVELALAAAARLFGQEFAVLQDVELERPLALSPETLQPVQVLLDRTQRSYGIYSRDTDGVWLRYATGSVHQAGPAKAPAFDLEEARARCPQLIEHTVCYEEFRRSGLDYGPVFRGLEHLWRGTGEALGKIAVPAAVAGQCADYLVHPAILDACFQTLLGVVDRNQSATYLPARLERVRVHRTLPVTAPPVLWSYARRVAQDDTVIQGDLRLLDEDGNVFVEIQGLRCQSLRQARAGATIDLDECLYEEKWLLQPLPGQPQHQTPAWRLPTPKELTAHVRPLGAALARQLDLRRRHEDSMQQRRSLIAAYFVEACRDLGWEVATGQRFRTETLLEQLRIAPYHRRLFARFLQILENEAILRHNEGQWEVVGTPARSAQSLWQDFLARFPAYHPEIVLLDKVFPQLSSILRGDVDPAEVLCPGGSTSALEHLCESGPSYRIYNLMLQQMIAALVERLPRARPLRILEVGAGPGSAAAHVLPLLPAQRSTYVLTDISPDVLGRAVERFADRTFVQVQSLDIECDPLTQDFEPHSFDVVLAFDVLHTAMDLRRAVESIKKLLAPQGLLILAEIHSELLALPTFGILKDWWQFTDQDLRSDTPLLSPQRWCELLRDSDFTGADYVTALPGEEQPAHSIVVAQAPSSHTQPDLEVNAGQDRRWLILADHGGIAEQLAGALKELGASAILARAGDSFRRMEAGYFEVRPAVREDLERLVREGLDGRDSWAGVVHLWGLDTPPVETLDPPGLAAWPVRNCMSVIELVRACQDVRPSPRLWLVTQGCQSVNGRPLTLAQAPLWGLGRVLRIEQPQFRYALLDLGPQCGADEIQALADELWQDGDEEEIALRGRDRYVQRLLQTELREARNAITLTPDLSMQVATPFRLEGGASGLLDDLAVQACTRSSPGPGQVEIQVVAAALNFKDVAKVMRLLGEASLEGTLSGQKLGLECAGRVTAVGPGVTGLRVGDDVVGLVMDSFASHTITDARLVVPKPADLTFEEAATLPIVFLTAYYALHHLGRLQAGERVLIHAGAGGVGLAAIQLAQRAGAEIFATAGSPEKRHFLDSLGVEHVMDSRSLNFVDEILERTGGRGVDVVLNSLGGAALVQSLNVVAEGGRFLEIGKRDLELNTRLGLRPFLKQLSFFSIDLDRLLATRPELPAQLFREVMQQVERGELRALPHTVFPISRIQEAFRAMLKARHIGKIVISVQEPFVAITPAPSARTGIRADGTYLITGGLGGFGRATAEWLVEQGARHLALLGRSGVNSADARAAIDRLEQAGAVVAVVQADVADSEQLAQALTELRRTMPPLRGIFHAAMVLDDGLLTDLDERRFRRVLEPKILGAWNLHLQTRGDPVECFVLFSSCVSLLGNAGQANYAAANLFLDRLAHERRRQGLPALSVNWGVVGDVGYVAGRANLSRQLEQMGLIPLPARVLLNTLGHLLQCQVIQSSVLRADWRALCKCFPMLAKSPRLRQLLAQLRHSEGDGPAAIGDSLQMILALPSAERSAKLQALVSGVVAKVLGTSPAKVDADQPMSKLGLDSLMAMELATRMSKELQVDLPTMTLMSGPSIAQLTATLLERLAPPRDEEQVALSLGETVSVFQESMEVLA